VCSGGWWGGRREVDGVLTVAHRKIYDDNERRLLVVIRHLVATSLWATWHLDSVSARSVVGGGDIAHLSSSLCFSVCGCTLSTTIHSSVVVCYVADGDMGLLLV